MSRVRSPLGILLSGAATVFALIACDGSSEGTVVAKADHGAYHYACQAGGILTSPVAVPIWGTCSAPECWQLTISGSDGDTSKPCVSREEYDRSRLGAFWHGRTDR